MKRSLMYLVALVAAVMPSIARAQANAPVVAVLAFENSAFGPGAKDYDGIGKGIMDLMITDLASPYDSRMIATPGQSGDPLSGHYGDLAQRWRDFAWLVPGRSAAVSTLVLVPQP